MRSIIITFLLAFSAYAQVNTEGSQINDKEQGSAKFGNLADEIETIDKGMDIGGNAKKGVDAVKWYKNTPKSKRFSSVQSTLLKAANKYQNTKLALTDWIKKTTAKVSEISTKVNDRIKLWNTTLPTMQRYWQNTNRLVDNTVDVFRSFNPSDLLDIDRKWDRKMQSTLDKWPQTVLMWYSFYDSFDRSSWSDIYRAVFVPDNAADHLRSDNESSQISDDILSEGIDPVISIPHTVLENVAANLLDLKDLNEFWNGRSSVDKSKTIEEHTFEVIGKNIADKDQTYEDERELSSLIETERSKVSNQTTQIQQRITFLSIDLARLHMLDREKAAAERGTARKALALMVSGGKKEDLTSDDYDEAALKSGVLK